MKTSTLFLFISLLCFSCTQKMNPIVVVHTNLGTIEMEIYTEKAPATAVNFLKLVIEGVYDGACFYRVVRMDNQPQNLVKIEVIQGGLQNDSIIETHQPIIHETTDKTGIKHQDGVISMARNEPGTASTEFFICIGNQPELDFGGKRNPDGQGFAAFGKVTKGMDVVRKIQQGDDVGQMLKENVVIEKMKINY